MAKGLSPTQRTIRALKNQGYICGIVERFNPHVGPYGIRQDLFGFVDIIAIKPKGICAIQSCGQAFADHKRKILDNELALEWLQAGGNIELWGWRKVKKKRGGKLMIWKPRIHEFTIEDFQQIRAEICPKCEGSGKVANTEEMEPWDYWERLPEQSKLAVKIGIVRPITCPVCRGTGLPGPSEQSKSAGVGAVRSGAA